MSYVSNKVQTLGEALVYGKLKMNEAFPENTGSGQLPPPANKQTSPPKQVKVSIPNSQLKIVFDGKVVQAVNFSSVISKVELPAPAIKHMIVNNTLFIAACGKAGLITIDFSIPTKPKMKVLEKGRNIQDFRIDGNTVTIVGVKYDLNVYKIKGIDGKITLMQVLIITVV
jgi:hypothetical protein